MKTLQLQFLGAFQANLKGQSITRFESDRVRILLAYLAVENHQPHRRDKLAAWLFPDNTDSEARRNLRQALFRLRKAIGDNEATSPFLLINRQDVQFNMQADVELDVADFLSFIKQWEHDRSDFVALERAIGLYREDFLYQLTLPESLSVQEWVLIKQEWVRRLVLQSLEHLNQYFVKRAAYEQAERYLGRQLHIDPLAEAVYRVLMQVLVAQGKRAGALAVYEKCRHLLHTELAVTPESETIALYESIRNRAITLAEMPAKQPPPHNLPATTTSFHGRQVEIQQISTTLQEPHCRLLTITGMGGMGKSRLAQEVGRSIFQQSPPPFGDGIYWIPMDTQATEANIITTIGNTVGVRFDADTPLLAQLISHIEHKAILLILDNFEHLVAFGGIIAGILQATPHTKCLVTSRESLKLYEEWVVPLDGLTLTDSDNPLDATAVQLFALRARHGNLQFSPQTQLPDVVQICQLVEGMPLAIELAAAWVYKYRCADIAQIIRENVHQLVSDKRNLPDRHRSLFAVFEHSWQLLSPTEQNSLARLSVFRGGFSTEAAEAVAEANPKLLNDFTDKSLIKSLPNHRFGIHEQVRQFLGEKLARNAVATQNALQNHAVYFASFLQEREPNGRTVLTKELIFSVEVEIENVRAAWQWACQHQDEALINAGMETLSIFYSRRGYFWEAKHQLQEAADAMPSQSVTWAKLQARMARFYYRLGHYQTMCEACESGLPILMNQANDYEIGHCVTDLATGLLEIGQFEKAQHYFEKGYFYFERCQNHANLSRVLNNYSGLNIHLGRYETAKQQLAKAISLKENLGFNADTSTQLINFGMACVALGDYEEGIAFLTDGLQIAQSHKKPFVLGWGKADLAVTYVYLNQLDLAEQYAQESYEIAKELNSKAVLIQALFALGSLRVAKEQFHLAENVLTQCLENFEANSFGEQLVRVTVKLAEVKTMLGAWVEAENLLEQGNAHAEKMGVQMWKLTVMKGYGILKAVQGDRKTAQTMLRAVYENPNITYHLKKEIVPYLDEFQ